jgi:cytochrome c oxidase subunit 2
MLVAAGIVFLGAVGLLVLGWVRRDRPGLPLFGESEHLNTGMVLLFGMAVPLVVVSGLFVVANVFLIRDTEAPARDETEMTVTAIGHQWFWEIRYPEAGAVTANEIHIPVETSIDLVARSADVIHSFWVPALNRKVDMIPGKTNRIELYAEEPGVFRGQCSEFCGLQHANMAFDVVAEPRGDFDVWLAREAEPALQPEGTEERRGKREFLASACASCHTIRGTSAQGTVGPDLTHLASRRTLGALTIPNRHGDLSRWIADPQSIKPGNRMPDLNLSGERLRAIVAYLSGLK